MTEARGAEPFAAEWILASGRQAVPDETPKTRWVQHADEPDTPTLSEVGEAGAYLKMDEPVGAWR